MTEQFTPEEIETLSPYVSNTDRPVFVVENLPEEVVAVLFAYYSRSKESLRRNLLKLVQEEDLDLGDRPRADAGSADKLAAAREKAKQFHEKWVVGYGHASVAEHAIAHIAIEDASIVASKVIEDNRLASYTEKSTRYVVFDPEKYYKAPELDDTPFRGVYHDSVRAMMSRYAELTPQAIEKIKEQIPRREGQTALAHTAACRAKACDVLRYILPSATFTNIGLTVNGRALEHMITKLLSHPLSEAREIGEAIKREAVTVIPTLLKYADYNPYMADTHGEIGDLAAELIGPRDGSTAGAGGEGRDENRNKATLVDYDDRAEDKLVAAILYEHTGLPASEVEARVRGFAREQKERVIDEYLKRRGKWDEPLRALEHVYYTFDILIDYGAFRDIQRHRMATQTTQLLTDAHGYETPPEIIEYGYRDIFAELMERASDAYRMIAPEFPQEAQYVLPLAYRKRALFTWNLRSLHHFISLRSAKQGHASYRAMAQQVFREIGRVQPLLARYIRVDLADYALARI
ncbi:MAG TPA: FAD-dependent thymidylate synthase [Blastocatellia bacterium]|nr:FAD-dependent thymidylate synthase [Blastocatellia bacterium]